MALYVLMGVLRWNFLIFSKTMPHYAEGYRLTESPSRLGHEFMS